MAYKSNDSFLEKVTMGAEGCRKVATILRQNGHDIIELERYSTSNKIWETKVKRIRVPDLLCLTCGSRFEVRAKSKLRITMSDSPSVKDRSWDFGLRNQDYVVLIYCERQGNGAWQPADEINVFRVQDLRATVAHSVLGRPKSASEGAERDRTWPAWVPGFSGRVVSVTNGRISVRKDDGRTYPYRMPKEFTAYVQPGDIVTANATIAAGVIPAKASFECTRQAYSFLDDLNGNSDHATLYAATKALGFQPHRAADAREPLLLVARQASSPLIRLEAAASLARLGDEQGWMMLQDAILKLEDPTLRMESILILGELEGEEAKRLLIDVLRDRQQPEEIRAAALWGLAGRTMGSTADLDLIADYLDDSSTVVRMHAVVATSRCLSANNCHGVLARLRTDARKAPGIVWAFAQRPDLAPLVVDFAIQTSGQARQWVIYLLGLYGRDQIADALKKRGALGEDILRVVSLFWDSMGEDWTLQYRPELDWLSAQRFNCVA